MSMLRWLESAGFLLSSCLFHCEIRRKFLVNVCVSGLEFNLCFLTLSTS